MNNRREELGYVIQEIPDPHYKKNGVELFTYNPDYDNSDPNSSDTIIFKVPYNWLEKEVRDWYDRSVQDFLLDYTHDDSELILKYALKEDVVLEIKELAILK
ncbi:hypothetical protein QO179_24210 [Bacillus stercoris]|nr:hypothetical protein [Bacillus stercoris]